MFKWLYFVMINNFWVSNVFNSCNSFLCKFYLFEFLFCKFIRALEADACEARVLAPSSFEKKFCLLFYEFFQFAPPLNFFFRLPPENFSWLRHWRAPFFNFALGPQYLKAGPANLGYEPWALVKVSIDSTNKLITLQLAIHRILTKAIIDSSPTGRDDTFPLPKNNRTHFHTKDELKNEQHTNCNNSITETGKH